MLYFNTNVGATLDQKALGRRIIQFRPGQLDLDQLLENLTTEVLDGALVAGLGRVHSELPVERRPGEP